MSSSLWNGIKLAILCEYKWGCRSFLTPWRTNENVSKAKDYVENKGKYYGRLTYAEY